jgi:ATP-dependent DNA helicase RecG
MARFKGIDRHEFLDSDLVYGNTFDLLEKGMLFVRKHLPLAGKIEPGKLERVETLLIPFDAVREALINALCHSDFSHYSGSIGLAIYDDRMEIFNPGGLQNGVTLEKIKKGFSKPRNSLIADVFYRANLIEKWGRGIPGIIGSCKVARDPEPEFDIDNLEFKIIFRFPKNLQTSLSLNLELTQGQQLTERQQKIIEIIAHLKEAKAREIAGLLKESITERTLQRELAILKKMNIIKIRGRAKTAVWVAAYSTKV